MLATVNVQNTPPPLIHDIEAIYAAAENRIAAFEIGELPAGAKYTSAEFATPDTEEELSPAARAQIIMQNVGSICFGETPDVVKIHAPDGFVHEIATTDRPRLLAFLTQKGYTEQELPNTIKYPLTLSGELPVPEQAEQVPTINIRLPKTLIMNGILPVEYGPAPTGKHSLELMVAGTAANMEPVAVPAKTANNESFSSIEQLGIMRRALAATHADLVEKYDLTEQDIDYAWTSIYNVDALNQLVDTHTYGRNLDQPLFDARVAKVIKTALTESIHRAPSKLRYGNTVKALNKGRSYEKIERMWRAQEAEAVINELDICQSAEPAKTHFRARIGNIRKRIGGMLSTFTQNYA